MRRRRTRMIHIDWQSDGVHCIGPLKIIHDESLL